MRFLFPQDRLGLLDSPCVVSSLGEYTGPRDPGVHECISLSRAARLSLQEALQRLDRLVIVRQRRVQLALYGRRDAQG